METIKSYLDNMFASLPRTARVTDIKNNILSNMEEKYNELKQQGKSENEAIGIVISEFGNIDELISELGIQVDGREKPLPIVNREEVEDYLAAKKVMGLQIGIGVVLCILAPAMLILSNSLFDAGILNLGTGRGGSHIIGLTILFVLIAAAVGIFIFSGMNFERYKYMEEGVQVPGNIEAEIRQLYDRFIPVFNGRIIVGVGLIILSPLSVITASQFDGIVNDIGVVILLLLIAAAVFLLITSGMKRDCYECLLKVGDYSKKKNTKEDKVIGAVASIVWPLTAAVYLFISFVYHLWAISWIVFPITGILFGMFCAAYSIITSKDK